jgi:hypothetical protein
MCQPRTLESQSEVPSPRDSLEEDMRTPSYQLLEKLANHLFPVLPRLNHSITSGCSRLPLIMFVRIHGRFPAEPQSAPFLTFPSTDKDVLSLTFPRTFIFE